MSIKKADFLINTSSIGKLKLSRDQFFINVSSRLFSAVLNRTVYLMD